MFERTVRRRLSSDGYRRCDVYKRITISRVNKERRRRFCGWKLTTWTVCENWARVIFSDEMKIMLGNNKKKSCLEECLTSVYDRSALASSEIRSPPAGFSIMEWQHEHLLMGISTLRNTFPFWMRISGQSLRSTSQIKPTSSMRKKHHVMFQGEFHWYFTVARACIQVFPKRIRSVIRARGQITKY